MYLWILILASIKLYLGFFPWKVLKSKVHGKAVSDALDRYV